MFFGAGATCALLTFIGGEIAKFCREPSSRGAIRPFLANRAFDPETIRDMSLALERVCETLDLRVQDNPATRLMAKKIIELAERGVRGDALSSAALKEFKYEE
jgi:hypothetical protein